MLLFCPICHNILTVDRGEPDAKHLAGLARMACRTCPFQYEVKKKMYETIRMKRKEAEDVLGGKDAWENVDSTEGKFIDDLQTSTDRSVPCPEDSCDGARAFFYQVQIRSADEPMTTFYKMPIISYLRKFFQSGSPAMSAAAKSKAQQIIDENSVAVFSKSYCPYCRATKSLLSEMGAKPFIIELDQVDDGSDIQNALREMTGQSSVPNIFIDKKHIGGNSELQAKKSELPTLLKEANAI